MKDHPMKLPFALALIALLAATPALRADDEGDGDGREIPLDVSDIYFELNDTDGDLGIHALIDGEPWKQLSIENPAERELLDIRVKSKLRRQGLTELFFESAEPPFDELPPEEFFARFPEGIYEVEGITLEGDELEGESLVTHLLPAPAGDISVNRKPVPEDCDEGPVPEVFAPLTVTWDAVTQSHPEIGRTDEPITVTLYQLVLEREEPTPLKLTFDLPPDVTEVTLPSDLFDGGDEVKIEVLVREESGNQTATESCFEVGE